MAIEQGISAESFYTERFVALHQALKAIDGPNFIFKSYGDIPIKPEGCAKGLRWGMLRALSGSYNTLHQLGATMEVQAYLAIERINNTQQTINDSRLDIDNYPI